MDDVMIVIVVTVLVLVIYLISADSKVESEVDKAIQIALDNIYVGHEYEVQNTGLIATCISVKRVYMGKLYPSMIILTLKTSDGFVKECNIEDLKQVISVHNIKPSEGKEND